MHTLIYIPSQHTVFSIKVASSLDKNLFHLHLLKSHLSGGLYKEHLNRSCLLLTASSSGFFPCHFVLLTLFNCCSLNSSPDCSPPQCSACSRRDAFMDCSHLRMFLHLCLLMCHHLYPHKSPSSRFSLLNVFHRDAVCFCNWFGFWHMVGWWYLLPSQLEGQTFSYTARSCSPTATKTLSAMHSVAFSFSLRQLSIFRVRSCV